jgi:preprotein translocase subunit SecD
MTSPDLNEGPRPWLGVAIIVAGVALVLALVAGSAIVLTSGDGGGDGSSDNAGGTESADNKSDAADNGGDNGDDIGGANGDGNGGADGKGNGNGNNGPPESSDGNQAPPSKLADTGRPPSTIEIRPVIDVIPRAKHCGSDGIWCGANGMEAYRLGPAVLRTQDIVEAEARLSDYGEFVVGINLSDSGATKFEAVTRALSKKPSAHDPQLAVVVNDVVISAPAVQGPVPGGEIDISADFTQAEAKRLAAAIDP